MSHVDSGPLASYNSLQDKHLIGYFNNTRMRRHLRRSGLITRNGEIVTENTFRLNMARREHQKHVRDLMAQAIVHKALDMERHRQVEVKRKLEEIGKVELVHRVRSSRGRKGDEDITPYLSPRAPSGRPKSAKQERPRSVVSGHRPSTAPSKHSGATKKKSAVYVDREGFPVHREQAWGGSDDGIDEVDSHNLRELDQDVMNSVALNMSPEGKQNNSPYQVDLTQREPKPPPGRSTQGSRKSPRGTSRTVVTRDGRRIRPKSNKGSLALHRKEPAYPHPNQQQTLCDVTIHYRGSNLKLQYERQDKRDEIIINQQHCGGENLVVFHGLVEPGTDLVFTSRRHRGYPFSLTFFINSIQVLRLSACCEYKYGPGVLLGGRKGHFKFGRVDGGSPCYRCMVEAELARRERQRYKDTQTEEPKPEPEPEPVTENQGTQSEPPAPETRDQAEQAQAADAEAEAYDDEDFEDEDDKQVSDSDKDTPKTDDKHSDPFFSGAESDTERKQPEDANYREDSDFEESSEKQEKEKESDMEIQEESGKILEGEVKGDDAAGEISEAIQDGADTDEVRGEEVLEEQDVSPAIPEASHPKDGDHQSSRRDDSDPSSGSDSSSDSDGHNRVLSSSSSSSEDEDDGKNMRKFNTADASSSEFSSEDEEKVQKKRKDRTKEDSTPLEPIRDDTLASDTEKTDEMKEDIDLPVQEEDTPLEGNDKQEDKEEKSIFETLADKIKDVFTSSDSSSSESGSDDSKHRKKRRTKRKPKSQSSSDLDEKRKTEKDKHSESRDDTGTMQKDLDPEGTKEERRRKRKKRKPKHQVSSDVEKSENIQSDIDQKKDKTNSESKDDAEEDRIEKDPHPDQEEKQSQDNDDQKVPQTSANKEKKEQKGLLDSLEKGMKGFFGSSDSESAEEDKIENDPQPNQEEKQSQDNEDKQAPQTSPQKEKKEQKGLLDSLEKGMKGFFGSSDSESAEEDKIENDPQPNQEEKQSQDNEDKKAPQTSPQKEKKEQKGLLDSLEKGMKGFFGSSDSESAEEDKIENDPQPNQEEKQSQDNEDKKAPQTSPQKEKKEQKGLLDSLEKGMKGFFGSSDSESEDEQKSDEEYGDKAAPEEMKEKQSLSKPDTEKDEMPPINKGKVKDNDMFGPPVSDSEDDKSEMQKDEVIKPEIGTETGAVPETTEEKPKSSSHEDLQMQSGEEDSKEKDDSASLDKESKQDNEDMDSTMIKDVSERAEQAEMRDEAENPKNSPQEQIAPSDDETGASIQVEDKTKPDESQDDNGGNIQTEVGGQEDKQDEGSLSSRSSASESGSIAAGLDKDFRVLNLNAKSLDESKAARLVKALKRHKYRNLEYLLLRDNPLTDSGIATLIRSLIEKHTTTSSTDSALKLTHFDLGNTGMGDEAASELAKLLMLDTPLRNVNISENTLSAAAWETINQGLKFNKSLVTFSAEYAHLSDTSCVMMTEALVDHEKLEELNIEGNSLGERAGKALAQLVKDNSVIVTINMERDNSIPSNIQSEVKEILETGSYVA